mgnify:CR=1 FL=1
MLSVDTRLPSLLFWLERTTLQQAQGRAYTKFACFILFGLRQSGTCLFLLCDISRYRAKCHTTLSSFLFSYTPSGQVFKRIWY